jgi:hypothetical protein
MTSKERVLTTLDHRTPDRIPMDFGGTAVTGIHVSAVAALRDHYGLEKRPVKVHEPYQMLGLVEEDLKRAMGIDVDGVFPRNTMFGFPAEDWKMWRMPGGLEVLVPGGFVTTTDSKGDILIYPEGDASAPPSGRMPEGRPLLRHHRAAAADRRGQLNVEDNLEEFGPIAEETWSTCGARMAAAAGSGRAVIANFGGTALGDIALVPAPFLKHPKGIRDVAEWYMSTATSAGLHPRIFGRQCEFRWPIWRGSTRRSGTRGRRLPVRHGLRDPDLLVLLGEDVPGAVAAVLQADGKRLDPRHIPGALQALLRVGGAVHPSFIEAGFDILNPVQCSAAGMEPEGLKSRYGATG